MSRFFILILIIFHDSSQAPQMFSVKRGESVTIPCSYDREYIQHKKYWCHGKSFFSCTILVYANARKGDVSVTDHPAEGYFTVTMDNLQTKDSGTYWCAVERNNWPDVSEALHITVKSDPDLSVMKSRVRGEEGGSITVQCLYSEAYRNAKKLWCRFRNRQCTTISSKTTSSNLAVQLSKDGRRLSVQMSGLKTSDTGWYWCSADELQAPVYISVSDPRPVVTSVTAAMTTTVSTTVTRTTHSHVDNYTFVLKPSSAVPVTVVSARNETTGGQTLIHWYLLGFLLPLVILVIITCLLRKKFINNQNRTRERSDDITVHTSTFASEDSIIYSTVMVSKPKGKKQPTFTAEDSIIYSTVTKAMPKVSSNDANESIYSSVVCRD